MKFISYAEVAEAATYQVEFNPATFLMLDIERHEHVCDPEEGGCGEEHVTWRVSIGEQSERQHEVAERAQDMLQEQVSALGINVDEAMAVFLDRSSPELSICGTLPQIATIAAALTRAVATSDPELYAQAVDWVIETEQAGEVSD